MQGRYLFGAEPRIELELCPLPLPLSFTALCVPLFSSLNQSRARVIAGAHPQPALRHERLKVPS